MSDSDNDCDKKTKDSLIEPLSPIKDGSSDGSEESSSTESSSEESNNDNIKLEPVVEPGSPKISQWSLESFIKPSHLQNETQNATSERVQKDSDDEKQSPASLNRASPVDDHNDVLQHKQDHVNQMNSNLTPTMMYNSKNSGTDHDELVKGCKSDKSKCSADEVQSDDIHSVLAEIKEIQTIKPISSLSSDSEDNNKTQKTNQLPELPIKKIKNKRKSKAKAAPVLADRRASSDDEDFSHNNVQSSTTTTTAKGQEKKGRGRPRKSKDRTKTTTNVSSEKEPPHQSQKNSSVTAAAKKDHAKSKPRRKKPEKVQSKPVIETSDTSFSDDAADDNEVEEETDKISQKSYNYKLFEMSRMPDRSSGAKDKRRSSSCEDSDKR